MNEVDDARWIVRSSIAYAYVEAAGEGGPFVA
jgi:hypothetical protein